MYSATLFKKQAILLPLFLLGPFLLSCSLLPKEVKETVCSLDIKILSYHVTRHHECIKKLVRRLYAKNPKYMPSKREQERRIRAIFEDNKFSYPYPGLYYMFSHEILKSAFSENPIIKDRVFLIGLGLKKAIDEAYDSGPGPLLTGCQIDPDRLIRLYNNISQVNWRLKTYKDKGGRLLFVTNERGESGYINMGYEVLFTKILTRVQDDIYLRGGLEKYLTFRLSSVFLSIL